MAIMTLMYVYDPDLDSLLYSALPKTAKTWYAFTFLLIEEMRLLVQILAVAVPILQLQVLFFEETVQQLESVMLRTTDNTK